MSIPVHKAIALSNTALDIVQQGTVTDLASNDLDFAYITCEGGAMRYTFGGASPTTSTGHKLPEDRELIIEGRDRLIAFRMIRDGSTNITVRVTFGKLSP